MPQDRQKRRRPWSQPLADLVAPCLAPAFSQFGFDEAGLLLLWPEIVGDRLAGRCEPLKLQWPPRRRAAETQEAAILVVRVEGAFAIELQHQAETVIERVNAHVGWRCVGRLALRQGPLRERRPARLPVGPAGGAAVAEARSATGAIADEGLREALVRLGARVVEARRG